MFARSNSCLSDVLHEHRSELRAAERKWHKSKDPSDWSIYQALLSSFSTEVHTAKASYFRNKINSTSDTHNLFKTFISLLSFLCWWHTALSLISTRWPNGSCTHLWLSGRHLGIDERTSPTAQPGKDWASCLPCHANFTAWFHHPARFFYNHPIKFSQKSWLDLKIATDEAILIKMGKSFQSLSAIVAKARSSLHIRFVLIIIVNDSNIFHQLYLQSHRIFHLNRERQCLCMRSEPHRLLPWYHRLCK